MYIIIFGTHTRLMFDSHMIHVHAAQCSFYREIIDCILIQLTLKYNLYNNNIIIVIHNNNYY